MEVPWNRKNARSSNSASYHRLTTAKAWKRASEISSNVPDCGQLFGSPPWSMMLEAYVARCEHRRLSTKSVLGASGAPFSSALRYLTALIDKGLLLSTPDPHDARRRFVTMTELGISRMDDALDKAADSDRSLGLARLELIK